MNDPQYIDAGDDPRLPALMAWRQQLIESGAVSRASFKEAHLRLVLRSGRTDVAQIRAMLPPSVAEHADEMARLLVELEIPTGTGESGRTGWMSSPPTRLGPMTVSSNATIGQAISPRPVWLNSPLNCTPLACGGGATKTAPGALELTWPPYPPSRRWPRSRGHLPGRQRGGRPAVLTRPGASGRRHHRDVGARRPATARRGAPLPGVGQPRIHPRPGAGRAAG